MISGSQQALQEEAHELTESFSLRASSKQTNDDQNISAIAAGDQIGCACENLK
jgi:hypothetical protein